MKTSLSILWHCECDLVIKLLTVIRNLIVTSSQLSGCCLGQTKISPFPFQSDHNYPNYGGDTGHFKVPSAFFVRLSLHWLEDWEEEMQRHQKLVSHFSWLVWRTCCLIWKFWQPQRWLHKWQCKKCSKSLCYIPLFSGW